MSTESVPNKEQEAPKVAASELASEANQPLTVNVPSGNLSLNTTTNFFYPYLPQTFNATAIGSGNIVYNTSAVGWASVNNQGFVFQSDQYNTAQRGF